MIRNSNVLKALGRNVKRYRKLRSISQERLGELADLHRTYISDIERGARNASIMNVWKLAQAMGITPADLCQGWDSFGPGLLKPTMPLEKETMLGTSNDYGLQMDIRYDPREFLLLKTVGTIDERTMPSLFVACSTAQRKYKCNRYFADFRQSRLRLNTGDIFRVPLDLQRHGITGHRASLVFSELGDDERFLEKVCAEAGVAARMFLDTSEALNWLRTSVGSTTCRQCGFEPKTPWDPSGGRKPSAQAWMEPHALSLSHLSAILSSEALAKAEVPGRRRILFLTAPFLRGRLLLPRSKNPICRNLRFHSNHVLLGFFENSTLFLTPFFATRDTVTSSVGTSRNHRFNP